MPLLVIAFLVCLAVPIGAGVLAHRRRWSFHGGPTAWAAGAVTRLGTVRAAIVLLLGGWIVTLGVGLALGFVAKGLESSVDKPTFHWIYPRVHANSFTQLNNKLTMIGNNPIIQDVCLVALIILACAYRRRWWIPVVSIAASYFGEHYIQQILGKVVDRGHPPTTLGTFPSGGVARILAVYATILLLSLFLLPALSRAWRSGLWCGLWTAAVVEAYTRIYLSKHWFTDAAFALLVGGMLLVTHLTATAALAGSRAGADRAVPTPASRQPSVLA